MNGSPQGLRTAEISNWTGKAIACPRSELKGLLAREECSSPGVYVLSGIEAESGEAAVYIGEAEVIRTRLPDHRIKDFWNSIFVFTSKDENLTKSHITFLEGKLIDRAREVGKAKVDNSKSSGCHLPESDAAEMEVFLTNIYQLLPVLGSDAFNRVEIPLDEGAGLYFCKTKGLEAIGRRTSSGFLVLKGSKAVLNHRPSSIWSKKLREKLKLSGILETKDDCLIFTRDYDFSSPSAASSAIKGGATNGLIEWKTKDGKTLKEIESNDIV